MNYRIVIEFSVNNDETEQPHPTEEQVIELLYNKGWIVDEDTLFNITELEVDVY